MKKIILIFGFLIMALISYSQGIMTNNGNTIDVSYGGSSWAFDKAGLTITHIFDDVIFSTATGKVRFNYSWITTPDSIDSAEELYDTLSVWLAGYGYFSVTGIIFSTDDTLTGISMAATGDTMFINGDTILIGGGTSIDTTLIPYLAKRNVFTDLNTFQDSLVTDIIYPSADLTKKLGRADRRWNEFHSRNITDTVGGINLLRLNNRKYLSSYDYAGTSTIYLLGIDSTNTGWQNSTYRPGIVTKPNPGKIAWYNIQSNSDGDDGDTNGVRILFNGLPGLDLFGVNDGTGVNDTMLMRWNGMFLVDSVYTTLSAAWADYVFDKDYKLMPLSEELAYIKQHRHLRSLQAANNEKYVNLQRRTEGLVEEVEKLYLYIGELQKEIELLKNK